MVAFWFSSFDGFRFPSVQRLRLDAFGHSWKMKHWSCQNITVGKDRMRSHHLNRELILVAMRHLMTYLNKPALCLPQFLRMLESYTEAFHELKPAQQLTLFPALGMVELEIELEDRTLHLNVEPIHASIIHLFEEQGTIYITIAIDR